MARAAFVGGVLAFTAAAIVRAVSNDVHGPSALSRVLALSAALLAIGGAACLGVAAILAKTRADGEVVHRCGRYVAAHGPGVVLTDLDGSLGGFVRVM
jgi:hypothetical protein